MKTTLTFTERINNAGEAEKIGRTLVINAEMLIGKSTKSMYIRMASNGFKALSQRGNGGTASGDICSLCEEGVVSVRDNVFARILSFAEKAGAVLMISYE